MANFFQFLVFLSIAQYFIYATDPDCDCEPINNVLLCSVQQSGQNVDTSSCRLNSIDQIQIKYDEATDLSVNSPSDIRIKILPKDSTSSPKKLRILSLRTNATSVEITVNEYSIRSNQSLFQTSGLILAPNRSLTILTTENVASTDSFTVFNANDQVKIYKYTFQTTAVSTNAEPLDLRKILTGIETIDSLTIYGNQHTLSVNTNSMRTFPNLASLTLQNLKLSDKLLDYFPNINTFKIKECSFASTSFLSSIHQHNCSLTMESNNQNGSRIQYRNAFQSFYSMPEITVIEPNVDSSILLGFLSVLNFKLNLALQSYDNKHFVEYAAYKPISRIMTISNLDTLGVFPPGFFNKMHYIQTVNLKGTFGLSKEAICPFKSINKRYGNQNIQINLESPKKDTNEWNVCSKIYIDAINLYTVNHDVCSPSGQVVDCLKWAKAAAECKIPAYENDVCRFELDNRPNLFNYLESPLANFFQRILDNATTTEKNDEGSNRAIPIIVALCALLVAIVILVGTVFFVRRRRQRQRQNQLNFGQANVVYKEGPPPNYNDLSHISIATTRTNKSMYPALDHSIFPAINPRDEIAPPLYTAPSESFPVMNTEKKSAAPTTYRASVLTNNTHLYETLDS